MGIKISSCLTIQQNSFKTDVTQAVQTYRMNSQKKSSSSCKKQCNSCNTFHSNGYLAGDDHWSKVLQTNDLDIKSLPSPLRSLLEKSDRKKSPGSFRKFCSRLSKLVSRKSPKKNQDNMNNSPRADHKLDSIVSFLVDPPSPMKCCEWDRVSVESVDSCYSSQPPSPSKCSSVSSTDDVDSPSFLTCEFPGRPSTSFQPRDASTPKRRNAVVQTTVEEERHDIKNDLHRISTWPPINAPCYANDEAYDSVFSDSDDEEDEITDLNENIREYTIPFEDLEFGRCLREGLSHDTFKGRWHGEVLIHKYKDMNGDTVAKFWDTVDHLSKLRHENVSLFMGVCPESDSLAVITSAKKGPSLNESIHQKRDKLSLSEKVIVARQIAQGMGYLHDKGYVLGNLNSENIHLESKVKICLIDQWEDKLDSARIHNTRSERLSYYAPEVFNAETTLSSPSQTVDETRFTKESDVYAFGTILYELFSGQYPTDQSGSVHVHQAPSVQQRLIDSISCPIFIKNLIKDCWSHNPSQRPRAVDISKKLQVNVGLQKRHSSSEPERLYKTGVRHVSACAL